MMKVMIMNILLIASIIYSCQQLIKLLWASKIVIIINKDVISLYYLAQLITGTLQDIKFMNTSTQEIEKIINSLIIE